MKIMENFLFIIVALNSLQYSFAKTYILFGLTGSGKSTAGNALINKSGDQKLLSIPFNVSDGASGCTFEFKLKEGNNVKVMDTIGFGDPNTSAEKALENFRAGLKSMNNKANGIIFVVKGGRITNEVVKYITEIQNIFLGKMKDNSILLLTHIREDWVKEQKNQNLQKALDNSNGNYFEFNLRFDDKYDDDDDRKKNEIKRQNDVNKLVKYIEQRYFNEVDLSFVHTNEYEKTWYDLVYNVFLLYSGDAFLFIVQDCVLNQIGVCQPLLKHLKTLCKLGNLDPKICNIIPSFKKDL